MKPCTRKWQVEAARDGRLHGKDLESAERHRDTCVECAQEARELAALRNAMVQLPALTRDPITVRRLRQQLLSAFNDSVLEPRTSPTRGRAALAFGGFAALLTVLWLVAPHQTPQPVSSAGSASLVEVQPTPEARWTEHLDKELDRIEFSSGSASFKVRAHQGRRVVISLPDGEIEDLGTVFSVLVRDQLTKRVAVREGRVSLRLRGRAETTVGPGESWAAEAEAALPTANETPPALAPPAAQATPKSAPPSAAHRNAASTLGSTAPSATASAAAAPSKADTESANAEDDAYLHVVALLRADKEVEARAAAKQYLLRFPNGFRRVEVLNIVTR